MPHRPLLHIETFFFTHPPDTDHGGLRLAVWFSYLDEGLHRCLYVGEKLKCTYSVRPQIVLRKEVRRHQRKWCPGTSHP